MVDQLHRSSHLHDRTHFDGAVGDLENRTTCRQRNRLLQIVRVDECVTADDILRLGERPVSNGPSLSRYELSAPLERMTGIFHVALFRELLQPGHPPLHALLGLFGGQLRWPRATAIEVNKFAHTASFNPTTSEATRIGQISFQRSTEAVLRGNAEAAAIVCRAFWSQEDVFFRLPRIEEPHGYMRTAS